jgi:hypothetical protein
MWFDWRNWALYSHPVPATLSADSPILLQFHYGLADYVLNNDTTQYTTFDTGGLFYQNSDIQVKVLRTGGGIDVDYAGDTGGSVTITGANTAGSGTVTLSVPVSWTAGLVSSTSPSYHDVYIYRRHNFWVLDIPHKPCPSFVPYALTGARWMYDNVMSEGYYSALAFYPGYRNSASAGAPSANVIGFGDSVRGSAWAVRDIGNAAWAAIPNSKEYTYFTNADIENWKWLSDNALSMAILEGQLAGYLPMSQGGLLSNYQGGPGFYTMFVQEYFIQALALAVQRGNTYALDVMNNFSGKFHFNRFLSPDPTWNTPYAGQCYAFATRVDALDTSDYTNPANYYRTWSDVVAANTSQGFYNIGGTDQDITKNQFVVGDYLPLSVTSLSNFYLCNGNPYALKALSAIFSTSNWNAATCYEITNLYNNPQFTAAPSGVLTSVRLGQTPTLPTS